MDIMPFSMVLSGSNDAVDLVLAIPRAMGGDGVLKETLDRLRRGLMDA
jgi:hypothetical protein